MIYNFKSSQAKPFPLLPGPRSRARAAFLILLSAGLGAEANPVEKRLGDLGHEERQDLYNYGIMASLAYRADAPPATGAPAGAPPQPLLTDAERAFLERTGFTCLGAKEKSGIRVLGFYNKDWHRLVIATRGTHLQDRSSMILNLVSDLGIGRHLTDEEIIGSLETTLRRQREEPGHLAPHAGAGSRSPAITVTAGELNAACELLAATVRECVPKRVKGETLFQRTRHSIAVSVQHTFNILYGATYGAASQGYASAKVGAAAGAGVGGLAGAPLGAPLPGALGGSLLGGVAAGIAGGSVGAVRGGYQALTENSTAIGLNLLTAGDGYPQTLASLQVVDGFAQEFSDQVNRSAAQGAPVAVVYTGHSLGGYLSTVVGTIRAGRAFSFNGPGVTAAKISVIAKDLQLPGVPELKAGSAEQAAGNITTVVLSSDLIGNLGVHEGTLITVRNADSPFGRNRDAMRWVRHELHAMVRSSSADRKNSMGLTASVFDRAGTPENKLEPAVQYQKTFATVALEQHSMRHLVNLLESLDSMADLTLLHRRPRPVPAEPASGEDYLGSPARAHRFQQALDRQNPLALPFAGDELAVAGAETR
jgi:hypothetical protein